MKNLSSILNVILLLAVAILFYLHFTSNKEQPKSEVIAENHQLSILTEDSLTKFMNLDSNIAAKPIKIAYVHNDSLSANLDLFQDVVQKIEAKEISIQKSIESKQNSFKYRLKREEEKLVQMNKQYTLKAPSLTDSEMEDEQKKMYKMQQDLYVLQQKLQEDLLNFSKKEEQTYLYMKAETMGNYYLKVQSFCKSFAKSLGFDFIMIYQPGNSFLYTNEEYDVTSYVVDAINKEYSQNKPKTVEKEK